MGMEWARIPHICDDIHHLLLRQAPAPEMHRTKEHPVEINSYPVASYDLRIHAWGIFPHTASQDEAFGSMKQPRWASLWKTDAPLKVFGFIGI